MKRTPEWYAEYQARRIKQIGRPISNIEFVAGPATSRPAAADKPAPNTNCVICGHPFYASPGHKAKGCGKYCSTQCRSVAWSGEGNPRWKVAGEAVCAGCGTPFHRKPSAHGKDIYCSAACIPTGKETIACEQCGTNFETQKCWGVRFCSKECASLNRRQQVTHKCVECGEEFSRKPSYSSGKPGANSFCSRACKSRFASHNTVTTSGVRRGTGSTKGGKRDDLGGRYFRSSWEANYARYLNWLVAKGQIQQWEYEVDTFEFPVKRGSRFYTPDFKVFGLDGTHRYIEVKGYMDQASRTKLRRMGKHYPNEVVEVVAAKEMSDLAKSVAPLLPNWERRIRT